MPLNLVLRAVPADQLGAASPARVGDSRSLTSGNLSIGRGPINDWVLADPLLSKTHCAVSFLDGRYVLTDLSTNGVFVNGARQRMAKDSQIVLTDGDSFALGGYVIEVAEVGGARRDTFDETVAPFSHARPGADPFAPADIVAADSPHGNPAPGPSYLARGEDEDPLQTIPPRSRPGMPPPTHFPPPSAPPVASGLPRGIDPFDLLDESAGSHPAPEDGDLFKGRDADPSWSGPAQRDDVDAPDQAFKAPRPLWSGRLDDQSIDDLLGDDFPGATPAAPTPPPAPPPPAPPPPVISRPTAPQPEAPQRVPTQDAFASPFDEPAAPVVARPAPPPQGGRPPAAATPDQARLLAAFLAGAGVGNLDLSQQDPEAYMRSVGELVRLMIERLREVLMSRAEVKREFGVDQTMLRSRNNNALKFSITPEDAVAALLMPERSGYLPPMQAAREALDDIGSHQVAVMAGVQTALFDLLKRFDPVTLEKRLTSGSFLDNIMPSARKARIWELFCATYKDIANEAQEDFHTLFGREFARGYNEQARKQ